MTLDPPWFNHNAVSADDVWIGLFKRPFRWREPYRSTGRNVKSLFCLMKNALLSQASGQTRLDALESSLWRRALFRCWGQMTVWSFRTKTPPATYQAAIAFSYDEKGALLIDNDKASRLYAIVSALDTVENNSL